MSAILSADGTAIIGFAVLPQRRRGDVLKIVRIAYASATLQHETRWRHARQTLQTLRGRSIIATPVGRYGRPRDRVAGGRITVPGLGDERVRTTRAELPAALLGPVDLHRDQELRQERHRRPAHLPSVIATPQPRVIAWKWCARNGRSLADPGKIDSSLLAAPDVNGSSIRSSVWSPPKPASSLKTGTPPGLVRFADRATTPSRKFASSSARVDHRRTTPILRPRLCACTTPMKGDRRDQRTTSPTSRSRRRSARPSWPTRMSPRMPERQDHPPLRERVDNRSRIASD